MQELIEAAKAKLGSYAEVSRYLGVSGPFVMRVKSGERPLPPIHRARLAELLGRDPVAETFESLADTEKSAKGRIYWVKLLKKIQTTRSDTAP